MIDENKNIFNDLVMISRYAVAGDSENAAMYVARMVRRYRLSDRQLSETLAGVLKAAPRTSGGTGMIREKEMGYRLSEAAPSMLSGPLDTSDAAEPILPESLMKQLRLFIGCQDNSGKLIDAGIRPMKSLMFTGKPGLGKTMSAYWLARELGMPLYKVDLSMIIGGYLGETGSNIRKVFQFARSSRIVLLLDELDSIAKTRDDSMDVGEMKRSVIVLLQELENADMPGVVIGATNHPEMVDEALWRRFDAVCSFPLPDEESRSKAIRRFLGNDYGSFSIYEEALTASFAGFSFAEMKKVLTDFRRMMLLSDLDAEEVVCRYLSENIDRKKRLDVAKKLLLDTALSQYRISRITGVSRDTLRKYKDSLI